MRWLLPLGCLFACACATERPPVATRTPAQKQVAHEIAQICALPAPERNAEIQRLRTEQGVVIVCQFD